MKLLKKDILALSTGKEIDTLIAENILNICAHEWLILPPEFILEDTVSRECKKCKQVFWGLTPPVYGELYCSFSEDIAGAWKVIEKLSELNNGDISIDIYQRKAFRPQWRCSLTWKELFPVASWEDTAPLAICRVALIAVMTLKEK